MKFFAIVALTLLSLSSFAQDMTKIKGANIICSQDGGVVFVNTKAKKVWQGDEVTDKEGLEVVVDKFMTARCPNCYTIHGRFVGMEESQSIIYAISAVPGDFKKAKLRMLMQEEGSAAVEIAQMNCKVK